MDDSEVQIQEAVGQLLAQGYPNDEIVNEIAPQLGDRAKAVAALRAVYTSWQNVNADLGLQNTDLANWHVNLRMCLLKKALMEENSRAFRVALAILDSLAQVQGVGGISPAQSIPLQITLVPKGNDVKEEDPGNPGPSHGGLPATDGVRDT